MFWEFIFNRVLYFCLILWNLSLNYKCSHYCCFLHAVNIVLVIFPSQWLGHHQDPQARGAGGQDARVATRQLWLAESVRTFPDHHPHRHLQPNVQVQRAQPSPGELYNQSGNYHYMQHRYTSYTHIKTSSEAWENFPPEHSVIRSVDSQKIKLECHD